MPYFWIRTWKPQDFFNFKNMKDNCLLFLNMAKMWVHYNMSPVSFVENKILYEMNSQWNFSESKYLKFIKPFKKIPCRFCSLENFFLLCSRFPCIQLTKQLLYLVIKKCILSYWSDIFWTGNVLFLYGPFIINNSFLKIILLYI